MSCGSGGSCSGSTGITSGPMPRSNYGSSIEVSPFVRKIIIAIWAILFLGGLLTPCFVLIYYSLGGSTGLQLSHPQPTAPLQPVE